MISNMKSMKLKGVLAGCLLAASMSLPAQTEKGDWAQFGRYAEANKRLEIPTNVVFMGNSITDFWPTNRPEFFTLNDFIGRGISGQTSYEMIMRFREEGRDGLTFDFILISTGKNYFSIMDETYMGELNADGMTLVLDGFFYQASYTDVDGNTVELRIQIQRIIFKLADFGCF